MPELYYKDALKLGQRDYRACVARGQSPCLPVMDDFVPPEVSSSGIDLGIMQIPAQNIVGTKTRGRTNSFAANFMPLLADGTEFSAKWAQLCQAHLNEGIRDPIKVYEYMNRYYVEEGNKRVSVLKFFDAPSILAHVIRVLPPRNGERETEIYYEYLAFYKVSKVNFLEFTQKGSYLALQQLVGKEPEEEWTEDERRHLATAYYYFQKAYQAQGGDKLRSTDADAMLAFIKVYGYNDLFVGAAELKKKLAKMWEEFTLQQEDAQIELKLAPGEEKKPSLLTRVLPVTPAPLKAAFLYDGRPERSGWVYGHEYGRLYVQRVLSDQIQTTAYFDVMDQDPAAVIEQAVAEGNKLIFTTSPRLMPVSLRAAIEHPTTVIMNCSLNKTHRYIRYYYARMYEAKFIIGAMAGSLSDSGKLGYVCDYPIYGQIAGINAFALGAQMTNPRAKVYLEWSSVKGADQAVQELKDRGIHLISSQDTASLNRGSRSSFGLSRFGTGDQELLARPIWRWGVYYETILRGMLSKTVQEEYDTSNKALNYYWGMSSGVVDLKYSASLPNGTRRLAEYLKEGISRDVCNPFLTPLHAQNGQIIGGTQRALSLEQIIAMDYLVENVVGSIPRYDELSPVGQSTVDMAGVEQASKAAAEERKDET